MAVFGGMSLTNKGLILQGKAQAGAQLNYTRIAVGDGSLSGQSIPALNALISQKKSLPISRIRTQSPNKAVIGTTLSNADISSGFFFREIGVFAQDPDAGEILYAYANSGVTADYIAPGGGSDVIEKAIDCVVIVGTAANITAMIDHSLVFALKTDLDAVAAVKVDKVSGKGLSSNDYTATEKTKLAGIATSAGTAGSATDSVIGNRTISDATAPTADTATPTTLLSNLGYMIKQITGGATWRTAPGMTIAAIKAILDAAVSAATANAIVKRDASGRAQVAAPFAAADIARKDTVDAVQLNLNDHTGNPVIHVTAENKTDWDSRAKTDSPALTGTPTAPTAAAGTNNTQLATTAFVAALGALKSNLSSPAFTGTPTAPTASTGTSSTQLATTAFVANGFERKLLGGISDFNTALTHGNYSYSNTAINGPESTTTYGVLEVTVSDGGTHNNSSNWIWQRVRSTTSSLEYRRNKVNNAAWTPWVEELNSGNHNSSEDPHTQYAPKASPTFTGTPVAPTATAGTNTTQIATTAFVAASGALKANLASPAFTGTPTAPTAVAGTNTTQIATTAFVTAGLAGKANAADYVLKSIAIPSGTDLDTVRTPGFHYCNMNVTAESLLNCPTTYAFSLLVETHAGTKQTLTEHHLTYARTWTRNFYQTWGPWKRMWDELNDGHGSNNDADMLDGQHGSYYAPVANPTFTGTASSPTFNATAVTGGGFQGIDADTVTQPSFTWTGDLDTGIWHSGLDAMGFTTGGVNRATVNSAGIAVVGTLSATTLSGALASTVTATTQAAGTNNTTVATTAFAAALGALKANLASPAFTGTPTAPTAAAGTNTTQLATTAFVQAGDALQVSKAGDTMTGDLTMGSMATTASSWARSLRFQYRDAANVLLDKTLAVNPLGNLMFSTPGVADYGVVTATNGDMTYYVRTDGNDANNGLANTAGGAFKTIWKALTIIPQIVNHVVTISVGAGTYDESVEVKGKTGSGIIQVNGAATIADTHIVTGAITAIRNGCRVEFRGLRSNWGASSAFYVANSFEVMYYRCKTIAATGAAGCYVENSKVVLSECMLSNKSGVAIYAHINGEIFAQSITGTGNNQGYTSFYGGRIHVSGTTLSASVLTSTAEGGIVTQGMGAVNPWGDNTLAQRSAMRVSMSAQQGIASGAWTKIQFSTVHQDFSSEYNSSLYRFTAKKTGWYSIEGFVTYVNSGEYMSTLAAYVSGTRQADLATIQGNSASLSAGGSASVYLLAGAYVELYLLVHGGSVTLNYGPIHTRFNITQTA